jgi:hypothetical protein
MVRDEKQAVAIDNLFANGGENILRVEGEVMGALKSAEDFVGKVDSTDLKGPSPETMESPEPISTSSNATLGDTIVPTDLSLDTSITFEPSLESTTTTTTKNATATITRTPASIDGETGEFNPIYQDIVVKAKDKKKNTVFMDYTLPEAPIDLLGGANSSISQKTVYDDTGAVVKTQTSRQTIFLSDGIAEPVDLGSIQEYEDYINNGGDKENVRYVSTITETDSNGQILNVFSEESIYDPSYYFASEGDIGTYILPETSKERGTYTETTVKNDSTRFITTSTGDEVAATVDYTTVRFESDKRVVQTTVYTFTDSEGNNYQYNPSTGTYTLFRQVLD